MDARRRARRRWQETGKPAHGGLGWAARRAPFMQKLTNAPCMLPATPVLHCVFACTHGFSELHELGPSVQLKRRRRERIRASSSSLKRQ